MFMCHVFNQVAITNIIIEHLKGKGVKYKTPKKTKEIPVNNFEAAPHVFQTSLKYLPKVNVAFGDENTVVAIPTFLYDACLAIEKNIDFEGIFRKVGSLVKQKHLKQLLNSGEELEADCHVVDVCNLVKLFFRELPEPLLPFYAHDMLLSCMLLPGEEAQKEALNLSCLLLQVEHLNVLTFFMQFLQKVTAHAATNKMDANNLSIVLTPSIMPMEQKVKSRSSITISHHIAVVKMLIESADILGVVPNVFLQRAMVLRSTKRRSGSITRMFTGIRRMVGRGNSPLQPDIPSTQEHTPRKRKSPEVMPPAVTIKRRREVSDTTPGLCRMGGYPSSLIRRSSDIELRSTPQRCSSPGILQSGSKSEELLNKAENKKANKKHGMKGSKSASNLLINKRKSLERKLSSMTWRKRRGSLKSDTIRTPSNAVDTESSGNNEDLVTIPRKEYEEMKTRVSCMERMLGECHDDENPNNLAMESEVLATQLNHDLKIVNGNTPSSSPAHAVQEAFKRTVEQSEQLGPQIRRDVRLRWSSERRVVRSPSERKIGTIRRRSRELARSNSALAKTNLQRGRPNTKQSGLPSPRDKSDHGRPKSKERKGSPSSGQWRPMLTALVAPGLQHLQTTPERRDSIASLRKNNIGMVQAKAKFFDSLNHSMEGESDHSNQSMERRLNSVQKSIERIRTARKETRQPLIKPALGSAQQLKTPRSQLRITQRCRATPLRALPDSLSTPQRGLRRSPRILSRSLSNHVK